MSCEHLICAQCAAPVVEGRCPACQLARAQVHRHPPGLSVPLLLAALLALLLLVLAVQLAR
jgi:predicted RNA-binding protein with PUA domain